MASKMTGNPVVKYFPWVVFVVLLNTIHFVTPMLVIQDFLLDTLPTVTGLSHREIRVFKGNLSSTDFFHQPVLEDNYFLIGARNIVYNISLSSLTENKRIVWYSSADDVRLCLLRQKTESECQNYIRVIAQMSKDEYLICGTHAFRPLCRTYRAGQKRTYSYTNEETGVARCPYDPAHNSTAVYIGKQLYSGTVADLSARDSLIFSKPLRTEQHDSQWLNDPNFVSSFAHDSKVYFFFRETAVENINCGKAMFSRVARVCTKDTGGSRVLRNTWTSFFKARLNCSIPGEFPFYFDEIQSTSNLGEGNLHPTLVHSDRLPMVYALFSTPRNSLRGAAVCAYKFSEIVSVFEGAYKEQRTAYSNWLPVRESDVPDPHPAKSCPNDSQILSDQTLNFIKSHPLMDKSVPSFGGQPLIIQTSLEYSFTQIAVDWQVHAADHRYYDMLFIGTDNGRILKAFNKGRSSNIEMIIVEVLTLFPNTSPITSLKVSKGHGHSQKKLIAVSSDEIRAVALHRCNLKTSCSSCVALKDPYCSWLEGKCINSNMGLQSIETGRHPRCAPNVATSPSTISRGEMSFNSSLCKPCACKEPSINQPHVMSNSLRNDSQEVPLQKTTLHQHLLQSVEPYSVEGVEEEQKTAGDVAAAKAASIHDDFAGLDPCARHWRDESDGYPLAMLLLIAFLPAVFTFFVGILIGCCLAIHKHSQFCHMPESCAVGKECPSVQKTLCVEELQKGDQSPNSEQCYKVVVNELKTNNSKQANGSAESSLQKANLNFL